MKKSKIVLGIVAAVLSAILLAGCAGGGTAVGKKYDAIYDAVNDYTIAMQKGQTYLFNKDKKVGKKGYYSIGRISANVSGYDEFFVAKERADGNLKLLKNDGTEISLDSDVKDISQAVANVKKDENGITESYTTEVFKAVGEDNKYMLLGADGTVISADYNTAQDLGGGFWLIAEPNDNGDPYYMVRDITRSTSLASSASGASLAGYATFADDVTVVAVDMPAEGGHQVWLYGKDHKKVAEKLVRIPDLNQYVVGCGDLAAYAIMNASDEIEIHMLDAELNDTKLDYKVSGLVGMTSDKAYVEEWNGNVDNSKVRVREFGGDAKTDWVDEIVTVASDKVVKCTSGTNVKLYNFDFTELWSINTETDGTPNQNVWYEEKAGGYAFVARTNKKIYADVYGQKNTYTFADGETVGNTVGNGAYVIGSDSSETRKLFTAYTNGATVVSFDGSVQASVIKMTVNGTRRAYLAADMKFVSGSEESLIPSGVTFTDEEWENLDIRPSQNLTGQVFGDVNIADKAARDEYSDKATIKMSTVTFTAKDKDYTVLSYGADGFKKKQLVIEGTANVSVSDSIVTVRANGSATVYELSGTGADVALNQKISGLSANVRMESDLLGNVYILENVNGRTAIYDKDGTLLLEPRYIVKDVKNGIVKVSQGDYYGIVKLGKKAKNAKLIKKMEYSECIVSPNGDFLLSKDGETKTYFNAKGKAVIKNVSDYSEASASMNYSISGLFGDKEKDRECVFAKVIVTTADGKDRVLTLSLKGKDTAYMRSALAFNR